MKDPVIEMEELVATVQKELIFFLQELYLYKSPTQPSLTLKPLSAALKRCVPHILNMQILSKEMYPTIKWPLRLACAYLDAAIKECQTQNTNLKRGSSFDKEVFCSHINKFTALMNKIYNP